MPNGLYWSVLVIVAVTGLTARLARRGPLVPGRATGLSVVDSCLGVIALLALGSTARRCSFLRGLTRSRERTRYGLTSHLIAIAGSVIVTVTVLTTVTRLPGPGPGQKLRSETTV